MTILHSSHGSLRSIPGRGPGRFLAVSFLVSAVAGAVLCSSAFATDLDDVNRLLRAGKHSEAMKIIEASLKRDPKNPRLRFAKGVVLAERKKPQEAIAVFQQLSEDYPDLPEPYNNLAVLYSQDNQFEKARAALNSAIKTNPSYATAYENLGDVHARIAAQSYSKALNSQVDPQASRSKLKMLAALNMPEPAAAVTVASEASKPAASQAAPALPASSPTAGSPVPLPAQQAAKKPETAATVAAGQPKTAVPAPAPTQVAVDKGSAKQEVSSAIQAWEKAWETKDMDAYIAAYDRGYYAGGSRNHAQWVSLRRARILGKERIDIAIEDPAIEIVGDTAVARFRQIYTGGPIHSDGMKTLTLRKKTGKWKITKEIAAD